MGEMSLGFLVSLKNAKRGILPHYGSLLYLFPLAKSPTTTAPPLCCCPGLPQLFKPAVYFPSQAISPDASSQMLRPLSSFHISALLLTSQGALSSPVQSTLLTKRPLKQSLPLVLHSMFFPSFSFSNSHYETNMQHENC